ncbi:DUF916 domain-containing protein [Paenisporosarcina antarctica]|uniref:DUF916 domain-containing protein n=1 Tax=Paenisporosarcina antarctica TaxID=417367 RepID=A0A4P7A027_9BACL|nr:DUF916 domain-containing protein [Paenisporosarcina antarctica]QBP41963.1 DUF916 domain-containing protein [Paenisporosarcina antarctica]
MFIRILAIIIVLFSLPIYASAAESQKTMQVVPIYPANQVTATKGYFDVDVKPGEQLTLYVRLKNSDKNSITVHVQGANAYTSSTGGIFYETEVDSDDSMLLEDAVRMTNYLEVEESVEIPAGESFEVPIQVTVPESDGETLLGGILLTQEAKSKDEDLEETGKDEAKFVINTETRYAIAIKLNLENKSDPNFSLGKAGFISNTAKVFIEMINDAQMIQGEIEGSYSILDSEGTELFKGMINPLNMAPKSKIRFPFAWDHESLEDGNYTLAIKGHAGKTEFSAEENFTISNKEVQEYAEKSNPNAVLKQGMPTWVWIVGAIVFGIIMFLMGRRKKPTVKDTHVP